MPLLRWRSSVHRTRGLSRDPHHQRHSIVSLHQGVHNGTRSSSRSRSGKNIRWCLSQPTTVLRRPQVRNGTRRCSRTSPNIRRIATGKLNKVSLLLMSQMTTAGTAGTDVVVPNAAGEAGAPLRKPAVGRDAVWRRDMCIAFSFAAHALPAHGV